MRQTSTDQMKDPECAEVTQIPLNPKTWTESEGEDSKFLIEME